MEPTLNSKLALLLAFIVIVAASSLHAGRKFNGTTDSAKAGCGVPNCSPTPGGNNPSKIGTFAFALNQVSYAGQQAIFDMAMSRGTCTTQAGPCTMAVFSSNGNIDGIHVCGCAVNTLIIDTVTPNVAENCTGIGEPSTGLHRYVFVVSATGSGMIIYVDGVAQAQTCPGSSGDSGQFLVSTIWFMSQFDANSSLNTSFNAGTLSDFGIWDISLGPNDAKSLANCVPPNRVRPDHLIAYWPFGGHESPEPNAAGFSGNRAGSSNGLDPIAATLTGTTFAPQDACPMGGAYP
jgi:hypothetical protein